MHPPWHTHVCRMPRLFPHCVLLPFLGSLVSLKEYRWRQSPSLLRRAGTLSFSHWLVTLNVKWTECESPSKRTYWACQLHPTSLQIDLPRSGTSDKASSAEAGYYQTPTTSEFDSMTNCETNMVRRPACCYSSKIVSSHTKNIARHFTFSKFGFYYICPIQVNNNSGRE